MLNKINSEQANLVCVRAYRILISFAVFSFVLTGALFISRIFLLPKLTHMQVAGENRDIQELRSYHSELTAQLSSAESNRMNLILPIQNEQYRALIADKQQSPDFLSIRQRLLNVAQQFANEGIQTVFFLGMNLNEDAHTMDLRGEVRNVNQRSMTVLAQFVEAVQDLPFVADVKNPRFTRSYTSEQDPFSPFTISITIR